MRIGYVKSHDEPPEVACALTRPRGGDVEVGCSGSGHGLAMCGQKWKTFASPRISRVAQMELAPTTSPKRSQLLPAHRIIWTCPIV
jgi:hypothetical protein